MILSDFAKKIDRWIESRTPICPNCFDPVTGEATLYRCFNVRCAAKTVDTIYVRHSEDTSLQGKVLFSKSLVEQKCDACGQISRRRICPNCHCDLPRYFGESESLIFSVIGAKNSGKSHYIAVLIDQLKKEIAPRLKASFAFVNDKTSAKYHNNYYNPLFGNNIQLPATDLAATSVDTRTPLIFNMSFDGGSKIKKSVTLVFFDTAGEDMNSEDNMSIFNKYIYKSDGIVMLLDPLQMRSIRNRMPEARNATEIFADPQDIIQRTNNLIRTAKGISQKEKIEIPLAVTFSKIDAIKDLLGPHSQLRGRSRTDLGGFDMVDFEAVNSELQALISREDEEGILTDVRSHFRRHAFFGVSALGMSPDTEGRIATITPHRLADPYLWLMYTHKIIDGVQRP